MSFWTHLRDAVEGIASVAGNFFLPGSSLVTSHLVSKGAQQDLASPLGMLAQLGSGVAGGMAGNLANYGAGLQALGMDTSGIGGMLPSSVSNTLGLGGGAGTVSPDVFAPPPAAPYASVGALPNYAGSASEMFGYGAPASTGFPSAGAAAGGGMTYAPLQNKNAFGWGSPLNLLQMGSGLFGITQAQQQAQMAQQAQQQQQQYRAPAAAALQQQVGNLLPMPTAENVAQLPGYQSGLEAVQRSLASQGYQGSGNMMAALQQYGTQAYQNAMQNYQQQQAALMGMAGTGYSPALGQQMAGSALGTTAGSLGNIMQGTYLASLGGGA